MNRVHYFDRPTQLGDARNGVAIWLQMFGAVFFKKVPEQEVAQLLQEVNDLVVPQLLRDEVLYADYRRLRVEAVKE